MDILNMTSSAAGLNRKGAWSKEEDELLRNCVDKYGEGKWNSVSERAGLKRCRKSCRLRWLNYLSPKITRGKFSDDEMDLLIRLHKLLGNRWSIIAGRIPGRTANDIKNYWNSHLSKKVVAVVDHCTNKKRRDELAILSEKADHEIVRPKPHRLISTNLILPKNNPHEGTSAMEPKLPTNLQEEEEYWLNALITPDEPQPHNRLTSTWILPKNINPLQGTSSMEPKMPTTNLQEEKLEWLNALISTDDYSMNIDASFDFHGYDQMGEIGDDGPLFQQGDMGWPTM